MKKLFSTFVVIGISLTAAGGVFAGSVSYVASSLGDFYGRAINDKGQIAGQDSAQNGVFRDTDGSVTAISGDWPGTQFYAYDINESGEVVGGNWDYALKWNRATGTCALENGLFGYSSAYAVNDSGVVVGRGTFDTLQRAVFWNVAGPEKIINPTKSTTAVDINNSGQVIGTNTSDGMLWDDGFLWTEQDGLTSLGGLQPEAINDNGIVVGNMWSSTPWFSTPSASMWTSAGGLSNLTMLSGWTSSLACDINDRGQIVGSICTGQSIWKAVIWNPDGTITELASRQGSSFRELRINNKGLVLCGSTLYTPVPEPSSLIGLLSGSGAMAGMFAIRRRKK